MSKLSTMPLKDFPDYSDMLVTLENSLQVMRDAFPAGDAERSSEAVRLASLAVHDLELWLALKKQQTN